MPVVSHVAAGFGEFGEKLLSTQYHIIHENNTYILDQVNVMNDLGVIFDSNLSSAVASRRRSKA